MANPHLVRSIRTTNEVVAATRVPVFSARQLRADMGLLLAFMVFTSMVGALCLLPAIARVLFPARCTRTALATLSETA